MAEGNVTTMKSYSYTAKELGLTKLPPGELRLAGFDKTDNPHACDVWIVPCDIKYLTNRQIHSLPYLKGNERRHALFCISDQPERVLGIPAIIFRADCNKVIMAGDPTTISWPWPVNPKCDIDRFVHAPREGFKYDVCFVGWNSTLLTGLSCQSVQANPHLKSFIHFNSDFYGTYETKQETEKIAQLRFMFLDIMHNSRLSLCARSIAVGVVRYRFYEAMAMGRIPVHINDGAVLPFSKQIDWDRCSISIPESQVSHTGKILREWLDLHDDAGIIERGQYGRKMWEEYLDGAKWDARFGWCVTERLAGRL